MELTEEERLILNEIGRDFQGLYHCCGVLEFGKFFCNLNDLKKVKKDITKEEIIRVVVKKIIDELEDTRTGLVLCSDRISGHEKGYLSLYEFCKTVGFLEGIVFTNPKTGNKLQTFEATQEMLEAYLKEEQ